MGRPGDCSDLPYSSSEMNDRFASLVDPIVQFVIETLRRISGPDAEHPGLDEVHAGLVRLVEGSRRSARAMRSSDGAGRHYLELAEYALVYWADEVLIRS